MAGNARGAAPVPDLRALIAKLNSVSKIFSDREKPLRNPQIRIFQSANRFKTSLEKLFLAFSIWVRDNTPRTRPKLSLQAAAPDRGLRPGRTGGYCCARDPAETSIVYGATRPGWESGGWWGHSGRGHVGEIRSGRLYPLDERRQSAGKHASVPQPVV